MTQLQTDKKLLKKLKDAATRTMTDAEIEKQRLSYVFGFLGQDSDMTKPEIARIIEANAKGRVPN